MNDTKQSVSEKSPEYLAATLREVAEMLEDVGKTIDARLGAWRADKPGTATEPETKPPSVEIGGVRFCEIVHLRRWARPDGSLGAYCEGHSPYGEAWKRYVDETPFSIWEACVAAGVPCPEPPHIIIVEKEVVGTCRWDVADVKAVSASGRGSEVLATARALGPFYTTDWQQVSFYTAMSPAAIRAACDEKGVPCPPATVEIRGHTGGEPYPFVSITHISPWDGSGHSGPPGACVCGTVLWPGRGAQEYTGVATHTTPAAIREACAREGVPCVEEPKTVDIISANTGGIVHLRDLRPIEALIDSEHGLCLRVNGYVTKAPLADIRAQAKAAGITLPPVTVKCSGWTWTRISAVTVKARSNDTLDTTIVGVSDSGTGNEFPLSSARTTPAQVCQLCKLAWWPKPQVRMVCTYCAGDACEIDPMLVGNVAYEELHYSHFTRVSIKYRDGRHYEYRVRESVAQVEAMRDACKGGE
jgi:hypothetical protein